MLINGNKRHQRVISFKVRGATDTQGSKVILCDHWHGERKSLGLSGADTMLTIEEYLTSIGLTIEEYGYTNSETSQGVIIVTDFAIRIK